MLQICQDPTWGKITPVLLSGLDILIQFHMKLQFLHDNKATEVSLTLQRIEVKLAKGKYEVEDLGHGPEILYQIRTVGLYLVVESAIGLAVIWDRKTTVRIMLEPQHSVSHSNCFSDND